MSAAPLPQRPGYRSGKKPDSKDRLAPLKNRINEWRGIYRSWPVQRRHSAALGLAFGFVAFNLLAVFSPLSALALRLHQKNQQVHLDHKTAVDDIRRRPEMTRVLADSSALLEKSSARALTDAASETRFLESIEKLARTQGLKIVQLDPFVRPDDTREAPVWTLPPGYAEVRTELRLSGGYHSFGAFVAQIENQPIFAAVLDIEILQAPLETPGQHSFRLLLGTVKRLKEPATTPASGERGSGL